MKEAFLSGRRTFAIEKAVARLGQLRGRPHINYNPNSARISHRLGVHKALKVARDTRKYKIEGLLNKATKLGSN